jgi:hypothetical protein
MIRAFASALLLVALAACGAQRDLEPPEGASLPPPPFGRADPPTAEELLEPTPEAQPARTVELRRQSEVREDDPFDLPPEG